MPNQINDAVINALSESLSLDATDVHPESHLENDLGVVSIDMMDIIVRLESVTGRKMGREMFHEQLRRDQSDLFSGAPMTVARLLAIARGDIGAQLQEDDVRPDIIVAGKPQ